MCNPLIPLLLLNAFLLVKEIVKAEVLTVDSNAVKLVEGQELEVTFKYSVKYMASHSGEKIRHNKYCFYSDNLLMIVKGKRYLFPSRVSLAFDNKCCTNGELL